MRNGKASLASIALLAIFVATLLLMTQTAAAQAEEVLYSFGGRGDAAGVPYAGLVFDSVGHLYGTTNAGGTDGLGTVFELSPTAGGGWREKVLHSFNNYGRDGYTPFGGVILDASGNLYGTTTQGGTFNNGTVFELKPQGGQWLEKIIYSFAFADNGADGAYPVASLVFDAAGNLYGTTYEGGYDSAGTVFELTHKGRGWSERVLHSFSSAQNDGVGPYASLIVDASGNLYGTTISGGAYGGGTVFELVPTGGGSWKEKLLRAFGNGTDGHTPYANLVFDGAGNLYGTTFSGGTYNNGTAFELTREPGGAWPETILHNFGENSQDGAGPFAALTFDGSGNLYGTTIAGDANGFGTVFELSPSGGGQWAVEILHDFYENGSDGYSPYCNLIFDSSGNLYGTTEFGGTSNAGTVFEVTP